MYNLLLYILELLAFISFQIYMFKGWVGCILHLHWYVLGLDVDVSDFCIIYLL